MNVLSNSTSQISESFSMQLVSRSYSSWTVPLFTRLLSVFISRFYGDLECHISYQRRMVAEESDRVLEVGGESRALT